MTDIPFEPDAGERSRAGGSGNRAENIRKAGRRDMVYAAALFLLLSPLLWFALPLLHEIMRDALFYVVAPIGAFSGDSPPPQELGIAGDPWRGLIYSYQSVVGVLVGYPALVSPLNEDAIAVQRWWHITAAISFVFFFTYYSAGKLLALRRIKLPFWAPLLPVFLHGWGFVFCVLLYTVCRVFGKERK